jgi:hypothetical protein
VRWNRFGAEPVLAVRNCVKPVPIATDSFGTGFFRASESVFLGHAPE